MGTNHTALSGVLLLIFQYSAIDICRPINITVKVNSDSAIDICRPINITVKVNSGPLMNEIMACKASRM